MAAPPDHIAAAALLVQQWVEEQERLNGGAVPAQNVLPGASAAERFMTAPRTEKGGNKEPWKDPRPEITVPRYGRHR